MISAAAVVEKMDIAAGIRTPTAAEPSADQRKELLIKISAISVTKDTAAKIIPPVHPQNNQSNYTECFFEPDKRLP